MSQPQPQPEAQPGPTTAPALGSDPRVPLCQSDSLLQGGRLYIRHGQDLYCLRLTKSGKLLLTK